MPLGFPRYIQEAISPDAPITYEWDDALPEQYFSHEDARLTKRIAECSARGVIALATGSAEWIVYRFSTLSSDPLPLQYIEAAWAGMIHWNHMVHEPRPKPKEWKGPVRGPLCFAIRILRDSIVSIEEGGFADERVVYLSFLARHVLPNPKSFIHWRDAAIERVARFSSGKEMGRPVPREALDPDFDFKPEHADELVARYLRTVSASSNPYLTLPPAP